MIEYVQVSVVDLGCLTWENMLRWQVRRKKIVLGEFRQCWHWANAII